MTDKLDVIFRTDRTNEITAVFPSEIGTNEYDMTCYAHVGQHGTCSQAWYNETRAATPTEYSALFAELRQVYSPEFTLVVKQRMSRLHRVKRQRQAHKMRSVA